MIDDFIIFSALTIISLTIVVVLFRVKNYNKYLNFLLFFIYFSVFLNFTCFLIIKNSLNINYNSILLKIIFNLTNFSILATYLYVKGLIKNQVSFIKSDLWHFLFAFILLGTTIISTNQELFNANLIQLLINLKNTAHQNAADVFITPIFFLKLCYTAGYGLSAWKLAIQYFKNKENKTGHISMKKMIFLTLGFRTFTYIPLLGIYWSLKNQNYFLLNICLLSVALLLFIFAAFLFLNPVILFNISRINVQKKEQYALSKEKSNQIYEMINTLMTNQNLHLDHDFSIAKLSAISSYPVSNIRDVIVNNGFDNFANYNNSFRISYANELIKGDYLNQYSVETLSKEVGFKSEVTFYKTFKKFNKCTPIDYWEKVKKAI